MRTVDLLVLEASQVVTMASGPAGAARGKALMNDVGAIAEGAVAVHRGRILAVGKTNEIARLFRSTTRIFAHGKTVLPGLVDAHTHPAFARWRDEEFAMRCRGASYEDILEKGGGILASADALAATSEEDLVEALVQRFEHLLLLGTTTVEAKSGYGLTPEAESKSLRAIRRASRLVPITVVSTFLGAHAVPKAYERRRGDYVRLVTDVMIPAVAKARLAAFCDVFCERGAFTAAESERILRAGVLHALRPKVHADEFSDGGGAALAARVRAVSAEHLGATGPEGIRALAKAKVVPVLLPTTGVFLGLAKKPDARAMVEAGCAVALASDFNPGSSPTGSLALAAALGCSILGLTPEEATTAVTRNAAAAIGLEDRAGALLPGRPADLVLLDAPSHVHLSYRMGTNLVDTVIRRGEVVVRQGRRVPSAA